MTIQSISTPPLLLLLLLLSSLQYQLTTSSKTITTNNAQKEDLHSECPQWAAENSCRTDPVFMLQECAASCAKQPDFRKVEVQHVKEGERSFFELEAVDLEGKVVNFERFEGYITIVLNVGKLCGRAEHIYSTLEQLHAIWPWTLEILIFPFNPFLNKQTTGCDEEYKAIASQYSKQLQTFQDVQLNGPNTHPVYAYLKELFGIEELYTEHGCTFLISPDGDIVEYHHRQHMEGLKEYIAGHLEADL